jgi:hypothetical protein
MVYNTRDYWIFGPSPSSGILKNTTLRKLDLLPSSGEGVGDANSVGSVRKSKSSHFGQVIEFNSDLRMETDHVSETLLFKISVDGQLLKLQ